MYRRLSVLVLAALAAGCSDQFTQPPAHSPTTPSQHPAFDLVAGTPITLGSGMTSVSGRDPANTITSCVSSGGACPSGVPMLAFVVPKHSAYTTPFTGTSYIAFQANGTTVAAPGYACCTTAVFENTFTLPAGATNASITISLLADNQASASVNGTLIGAQSMSTCNFCVAGTYTASFTPDPSGTNHLDITFYDGGGAFGLDYTATVTYSVAPPDNTPPVVTSSIAETAGSNGWYTSDVHLTFSANDPDSPWTTSGCDPVTVTSDTDGATYTCIATSAGGTTKLPVTIKRDATLPTVTYSSHPSSYSVDQTVNITCTPNDATNPGSGLASSTCQSITGPAYTFAIGTNPYSATATDRAGNVGNGSTSFGVVVTADGMCALTKQWVTKAGVANSLCVKLAAAAASAARGDAASEAGQIGAYQNEVSAQSGKAIAPDKAMLLSSLAAHL